LLDNKVTVLNQTPRAFYNLAQVEVQAARHKLLDLRYVIFGGERLDFEKLKSWNNIYAIEKIALFNLYGITETTVHTSFYRITDNDIKNPDGLSRIGVPLPETKIYLLDKDLQPVPALVAGEIYVAGTGVAAGYWNRPEITRERFIDCPFGDHKMYRSGDLALRDLNGCIQYIGRNDHQVKVRGYRIELREIECVLRQFPGVHEAVAIVKEEQGATELIAFVKADDFDLGKYGSYLKTKLPDYMVPSKYYEIDQFKLTANGKIDINVLKTWTGTLSLSKTLKRPTSAKEHAIADTAAKLLKLKSVSMEENFFYIGGDSIKALQLISRLYQTGYKIDLRDIFRNPTLAGIAGQLKPAESVIARGELNHKFVLTPVQQQFLEAQTVTPNHFCQSVLLKLSPGVTAQNITPALAALARDHEMLSTVFERSASGWTQSNIQWIAQITNINGADVDWREVVKQQCATMDLDSGPLFKACYHEGSTSYLLLVAHHLIVDIVSWQILLQDLDHYLSGADNIAVRSVPYSEWSTSIQRFAFSSECLQMINYWKELELSPLPSGTDVYEMNHAHVHRFSISSESTDLFVQWTKNNELSIGDTLPSLTGVAFCEAFNVGRVSGMIEGHGRDQRGINVDISRTIGWFTITYPSAFDRKEVQDWTSYVKKSSDVLSAARDNGIGFEIGQALSAFAGVDTRTLFRFNYLGNSSGYDAYQSFDIEEANHSTNVSEKLLMNYPFEVGMSIYKGKINCSITCDQRKHVETVKTIEKYITYFIESVGGVATTNRPKSKDINWYSLSPMQKGILFHSIYNKGSNNYFTQFYYQLDGALDVDSFRKAFGALITRHEIGRTIFRFGDGREPGQGTDESIVPDFELLDVTRLTASQQDAAFEEFRRNDLERNFDLTADSLIRLKVVIFGEKTFKIMWSYHHIVVDGWAMSLVMDDFNKCYENLCANRRAVVPFRPPYRRFIEWIDTNVDALANISYWKKYLLEYKRLASLPASNRTSQLVSEANIAHEYLRIDKKTSAEIKAFVAREEVTLYQYIQGIWAILLSIYNKTDDVVFGTVVSGRPPELPGIESTIGLFINAIPVRVKLNDDETFCQLLRGVRESFIESGPYSYFSMAEIQGLSLLKNNLIDHLLIFENFPLAENTGAFGKSSFDQLIVTNVKAHDINNYDLNVAVFPGEEITVRITYNNSKFDVEMISEALEILSSIVEQSLHDECLVNGLRKIPNAIRTRLIEIGRSKAAPVSFLVHKKFDELSRSNPSSPAVVADGREVGYGELNMMSKAIAAHLVQEGLSPTQVVAILMTPSVEIFASMLGVLEAGGVLLLIDPSTPAERQKSIIADSGAWGVCTTSDMLQYLGGENENVIAVDLLDTATDAVIDVVVSEADPMYVIYTSGTTGVPKGSKISHAGLSNMIADQIGRLKVSSTDVVLQFASMSFDGFMYETWLALTSGASILCLAKEVKLNPNLMIDKMKSSRVSIVALPPSYLHKALTNITGEDKPFEFLRVLISAGEAINRDAAIALSKYIDVFNLYGPSECAVTVTAHKIDAQDSIRRIIPIGVPITGYSVFILDESMQPVPLGVTGQIFVDSPGVSSGYINKIEATNAKFITATLDKRRRLYATGDAARWLPDGSIEYGGRIDNQLKLNGFRIEPEEVEAAIATRNGIVQVAVIPDRATDTLVAFVVSEDHLSTAEMRNYLIRLLPEYMIPARFVFPASLPLTSHGKIARNELVIPSQAEAKTIFDDVDDSTLNEVRKVWSTVLQHSNFTTGSNFFDVGGNSLLMIQMHGLLKTKWSFLEITDLFAHTTIGDISKYIRDLEQPSDLPELKGTLMAEEFCSDESNDQSQFEITGIMNSETLKLIPDQIDHWNTVLALFAYSLYERSLSETILFYGWNIEINSISTIQLDMNNISDSKELCTVIASQMKTSGPLKYRATISSNQLLSAVVVPGNYQQSTSAFDLIFKIGDDIGSENITMICNGSKVSRDGAHDLLKGFIENASNLSGSLMTSSLKEINS
jgi:iturin family lipopeptide synthetase C